MRMANDGYLQNEWLVEMTVNEKGGSDEVSQDN